MILSACFLYPSLCSFGFETINKQGSHGKSDSRPNHTCPPVMLPRQTGNECTGRTTQKVNGHINGIDTIDGRCVKGDYAGLIRQMDALHTGINQQDSNYYPQIAVIPPKCQYPCCQHYASSGNREEPRTVFLDVAADENHRGCTCQCPHKPSAPIMSSLAKKGSCFIRKARQLHKAKNEP